MINLPDKKYLAIGGIVAVVLIAALFGIKKRRNQSKKEQKDTEMVKQTAFSLEELPGGHFYIKTGDTFYALPTGTFSSTDENDTPIPKEVNEITRSTAFSVLDEENIPVLYSDSEIIYKSNPGDPISPNIFTMERFKDVGYSIGIRSLTNKPEGGKFKTVITEDTVYPESDFSKKIKYSLGDEIIIDKISEKNVDENAVEPAGIISHLDKNKIYNVNAFKGTKFIGNEVIADTHYFTSFEKYITKEYQMSPQDYIVVPMSREYRSGYYFINGQYGEDANIEDGTVFYGGMFRYINGNQKDGIDKDIDYNTPYYLGKDEQGNIITNPAMKIISDTEAMKEAKEKEFCCHSTLYIDNPKQELNVQIKYSEGKAIVNNSIIKESSGAKIPGLELPRAVLHSPDGTDYEFLISADTKNVLEASIKQPCMGCWTADIYGMYARSFELISSFTGINSHMVIKDSDNDAQLTLYVKEKLNDGVLSFKWEDTSHAAFFYILDSDGQVITSNVDNKDKVIQETYGETLISVGSLPAGEYKVIIKGERLGHVYADYYDNAKPEPAENTGENTEVTQ